MTDYKNSNENLLNSVLSELKHRIKAPSPEGVEDSKLKDVNSTSPKQDAEVADIPDNKKIGCNGIAEYSAYSKTVGEPNPKAYKSQSLPSKTRNLSNSKPPSKPVRRNKPADAKPISPKLSENVPTGGDDSSITVEIHELITSAFASPKHGKLKSLKKVSDTDLSSIRSEASGGNFYSSSSTLRNDDFGHKCSLGSIDSGVEGSAKSTKQMDEIIDDCFLSVEDYDHDVSNYKSSKNHAYLSVTSANSDEGNHSTPSIGEEKAEEEEEEEGIITTDGISVYSFASADDIEESKLNAKLLKAKDKAKQLKKQASARKEQVGAFFDAAAYNASLRIKNLRRPSLKFNHGKGKKLQKLANK